MSGGGSDGRTGENANETEALLEELLPSSPGAKQVDGSWSYTEVPTPPDPPPTPDDEPIADDRQPLWERRISLRSIALGLLVLLLAVGIGWFGFWLGNRNDDSDVVASQPGSDAGSEAAESDGEDTGNAEAEATEASGPGSDPADVADEGDGATETEDTAEAAVSGATLTATLERGRFTVAGSLPNPEVVARVRTTAAIVYGRDLADELVIDSSLPEPVWAGVAADVVAALPIISNGSIELVDDRVTVRGTAGSAAKHRQFAGAVQMILGPEVQLIDEIEVVEMGAPSLIIRKTDPNAIELTGVVPSEELGTQIQMVVGGAYAGHQLMADITVDDGVEETFALYSLPTFAALFVEFPAWEVSYVDEMLVSSSSGAASFGVNSAEIPPAARAILDSFAAGMGGIPGLTLTIEGHTDSAGDSAYNLELSERRAKAVIDYLVTTHGIAESRLIAVGLGEDQPIADNATEAGRTQNRRVDFIIGATG